MLCHSYGPLAAVHNQYLYLCLFPFFLFLDLRSLFLGTSGTFIFAGLFSAIPPRAGLILKTFPAASNAGPVAPSPDMLL